MPIGRTGYSSEARSADITGLLKAWESGDKAAVRELVELVYSELRRMARHYVARLKRGSLPARPALLYGSQILSALAAGELKLAHFMGSITQL